MTAIQKLKSQVSNYIDLTKDDKNFIFIKSNSFWVRNLLKVWFFVLNNLNWNMIV